MTPSSYQQAIYDWVRLGAGSAVVIAVAGSGKTTTLLDVLKIIPRSESVRFFAFNRQIADTLKAKAPPAARNVTISTYHSAGYMALWKHFGAKVDATKGKWRDLIYTHLDDSDRRAYSEELIKLIDLARGEGIGTPLLQNTPENWAELIDRYDLDFDWLLPPRLKIKTDADFDRAVENEKARVCELAYELLDVGVEAASKPFEWTVDFGDQLYLPILWDLPLQQYDWVLVDEAQDTNAIQREFIRRSLKPGGRLLAVGDPRQAIYAWRGASHDAIDLIQTEWQAVSLPLSVCYRCAKTIVQKAQTIVPEMEWGPDAPLGLVEDAAPPETLTLLTAQDAILCRNNAPLLSTAYDLISKGIPVRVLGRDIGEGLKKVVRRLNPTDIEDLEEKLAGYLRKETARYRRQNREDKAAGVEDRVACLTTIIDHLEPRTLETLTEAIDGMFGDPDARMLTLSTIHKAKGQEWPRVAIIRQHLIPSKYAKTPAAQLQELNLLYVAWTRAQERLIILDDKPEWLKAKEAKARGEPEEDAGDYFDNFIDGKGV